jgi:hypothetical protein
MIEMSLRTSSFLTLSHRQEIVDSDRLIDPRALPAHDPEDISRYSDHEFPDHGWSRRKRSQGCLTR